MSIFLKDTGNLHPDAIHLIIEAKPSKVVFAYDADDSGDSGTIRDYMKIFTEGFDNFKKVDWKNYTEHFSLRKLKKGYDLNDALIDNGHKGISFLINTAEQVLFECADYNQVFIEDHEYQVLDQAIKHLAINKNVFQFRNSLVYTYKDTDSGNFNTCGLTPAILEDKLSRVCTLSRRLNNGDIKKAAWPDNYLKAILDRKSWNDIPRLKAMVSHPFFRPDTSLCNSLGYDHKTQKFLTRFLPGVSVKENPNKQDAKESLSIINDLFCDFEFASEVDRAAALAGLLTPWMRNYYEGCTPLFLITASTPGTGKTLLTN